MLNIFKTVYKIFKEKHQNETQDFREGFELCYTLFKIGFKQDPIQYNLHILLQEAEKEQGRLRDLLLERDWLEASKERKEKDLDELNHVSKQLEIEKNKYQGLLSRSKSEFLTYQKSMESIARQCRENLEIEKAKLQKHHNEKEFALLTTIETQNELINALLDSDKKPLATILRKHIHPILYSSENPIQIVASLKRITFFWK